MGHTHLLRQRQSGLPLHRSRAALAHEARGDRPPTLSKSMLLSTISAFSASRPLRSSPTFSPRGSHPQCCSQSFGSISTSISDRVAIVGVLAYCVCVSLAMGLGPCLYYILSVRLGELLGSSGSLSEPSQTVRRKRLLDRSLTRGGAILGAGAGAIKSGSEQLHMCSCSHSTCLQRRVDEWSPSFKDDKTWRQGDKTWRQARSSQRMWACGLRWHWSGHLRDCGQPLQTICKKTAALVEEQLL
jgi:hypothetical protein